MSFPSQDDIDRLIEMSNGDSGFFIIAIYSVIEKYMKTQIMDILPGEDEHDFDRFASITRDFLNAIKPVVYNGWIPPEEFDFFWEMKTGKEMANNVRHDFTKYDKEEAIGPVNDILNFFHYVDRNVEEKLETLRPLTEKWKERNPPTDAIELDKVNKNIVEMQPDLTKLIRESEDYKKLEKELGEIFAKCETYRREIDSSKDMTEKLQQENEKLKAKQKEFSEKFERHERFRKAVNRMSLYTKTRKDFETSILRLTEEQQTAVDRIAFKQDYIIKGSAGTGKSLVLLKTLEKLIKTIDDSRNIYFITYTHSLVNYNSYIASLLDMGIQRDRIITADKFFLKILQMQFQNKHLDFNNPEQKLMKVIHSIMISRYSKSGITDDEIYDELTKFIWPNIVTKEEYVTEKISRKGMKIPLNSQRRQIYWAIAEDVDRTLLNNNNWFIEYAKYKVAMKLKNNPLYDEEKFADYVFVDETQDLSVAAMYCTKSITKYSVVMAQDMDQTINQIPITYSRGGLNVVGSSVTLSTNFRNTILINNVAEKYRKLIPGVNKENKPVAFRVGLPVSLIDLNPTEYNNSSKTIDLIVDKAKMCIEEFGYDLENICIVVTMSSDRLINKIISSLEEKDMPAEKLKDKDFENSKKISVTTIQSCKGLDFPIVILLANSFSPHEFRIYDESTADKIQRNMLYVATTRAMDELTVISLSNCENKPINDLKQCITEVNDNLKDNK